MNSEAFIEIVKSRRSVRVFDKTPVPEKVMEEALRLALLAPNSSNLQPWEFYWVKSPEKREKLNEACLSQPAATTAAEIIVCVARIGTWRKNRKKMLEALEKMSPPAPKTALMYYQKLVPFVYTQGFLGILGFLKKILFFCAGIFKAVPREPTSISDMKIWAIKSTALACENLMLAFRAFDFDTCPMEGLDSRRVKKILNLPCDAVVVMAVSVGKRTPQGIYGDQIRFDSKEFIYRV